VYTQSLFAQNKWGLFFLDESHKKIGHSDGNGSNLSSIMSHLKATSTIIRLLCRSGRFCRGITAYAKKLTKM
jgi:hypothetical protein